DRRYLGAGRMKPRDRVSVGIVRIVRVRKRRMQRTPVRIEQGLVGELSDRRCGIAVIGSAAYVDHGARSGNVVRTRELDGSRCQLIEYGAAIDARRSVRIVSENRCAAD